MLNFLRTNRQAKNYMPPIYQYRGIKKKGGIVALYHSNG